VQRQQDLQTRKICSAHGREYGVVAPNAFEFTPREAYKVSAAGRIVNRAALTDAPGGSTK